MASAVLDFATVSATMGRLGNSVRYRRAKLSCGRFVIGAVGQLAGLNVLGMKRRKFSRDAMHAVRRAYRMLFFGEGEFASRVDRAEAELGGDAGVAAILAFVREGGSRPLLQPRGDYKD